MWRSTAEQAGDKVRKAVSGVPAVGRRQSKAEALAKRQGKRGPIFYGWWIVAAGAAIAFYGGGVFYYGFGALFNPVRHEFGWSRTRLSFAWSFQRLEGGLASPVVGILIDRLGPRVLIIGGAIISSLGFLLMSQVHSLPMFYLSFIIIAMGFSGCYYIPTQAAIISWFNRKRGLALGLLTAGAGLSGFLVPAVGAIADTFDWRATLVVIAIGMSAVSIPCAFLVRHRPEPYGCLPDGDPPSDSRASVEPVSAAMAAAPSPGLDFTVRQALGTHSFWLLAAGLTLSQVATSSVMIYEIPALEDAGISKQAAYWVVTATTSLSLAGRLGFGMLADRVDKRLVLGVATALQAIGTLIFAFVNSIWLCIPFILAYAPGYGGPIVARPAILGDYFGRRYWGTIQGILSLVTLIGGLAGPPIVGWLADTSSYREGFLFAAIVTGAAVPLLLAASRPKAPGTA